MPRFAMSMLKLASAFAVLAVPAGSATARPLLLISIDGLRPGDVLEAQKRGLKLPNLRRFVTEGIYADGVEGVLPTLTYPSHTTIMTGVSPAKHGVLSNTSFDPTNINQQGWYWYASDVKAPNLWDAVHAAGGKICIQLWHVGRISHTYFQPNHDAPVAPSAIRASAKVFVPSGFDDVSMPRALEHAEIKALVGIYAQAARNAQRAMQIQIPIGEDRDFVVVRSSGCRLGADHAGDVDIDELVVDEQVASTLSHEGFIKRMPLDTYRVQHRGGKGVSGGLKENDFVEHFDGKRVVEVDGDLPLDDVVDLAHFGSYLRPLHASADPVHEAKSACHSPAFFPHSSTTEKPADQRLT